MIVTPSNSIGPDKVKLYYRDFGVKDATRSGFKVVPGTVDLGTGETTDARIFRDNLGHTVNGAKAIRNTELYQATAIPDRGLTIQLNPSKPYHPVNLVDDDRQFRERVEAVFHDLRQHGILAHWEGGTVTRLDMSRNVQLDAPVSAYYPIWPHLQQKRSKHQVQYPDGYGTGNDTTGTIFYDKGKEAGIQELKNLLRGEIQHKRNRAIVRDFGCRTYADLVTAGIGHLQEIYRGQMRDKVLRIADGANQHTIQFDDEISVLRRLMQDSDRTALSRHLQLMGIPYFLETYGTPDVYAEVMKQAGFSRMTINRQLKKIRQQIDLYGMIYRDERNTVGKMIREISYKLTA